jgi:hypothetical protein
MFLVEVNISQPYVSLPSPEFKFQLFHTMAGTRSSVYDDTRSQTNGRRLRALKNIFGNMPWCYLIRTGVYKILTTAWDLFSFFLPHKFDIFSETEEREFHVCPFV